MHRRLIRTVAERGEAIVLIGFMGSGKSSVGRALAGRTGMPRYDTDELVSKRFGLHITAIFDWHGEAAFREAEAEVLRGIPAKAAVIVTGGGIVLRLDNVTKLRTLGRVVHLTADEETLFARVSRRKTRPLLQTANPRQTLAEMLKVRAPLYRAAADVTIDTSAMTHEEVADAILDAMSKLSARAA